MDKYVKVRKIGQGSYGSAYLATRKSEATAALHPQQLVIKEIKLDPRDQASAQREARLLAALDHPNIVACKESFLLQPTHAPAFPVGRSPHCPTVLCIVTEFADGGDLSQELTRRQRRGVYFEPDELVGLFVQVCLALKHLHDRKILHRDVKPANIFLTKAGVVKLGDLGVATVLSHTLACAQTSIGTPYYTAPEICLNKRYNAKADVWSLGCVLFEMASFVHVFDGQSQRQLFEKIVRGPTPQLSACGPLNPIRLELQALVNDMLRKEPRARPSIHQIIHRPLVLARIQTFLSTRALASELNHTVLHGQNVFRSKGTREAKAVPSVHHVRRAEPVVSKAGMNPLSKGRKLPARRSSLWGATRNAVLRRSRSIPKVRQAARVPSNAPLLAPKQRLKAKHGNVQPSAPMKAKLRAQMKAKEAAAVAGLPNPPPLIKNEKNRGKPLQVSEQVAAFNAKWAAQKEHLVKNVPPPAPSINVAKKRGVLKPATPSRRAYPQPVRLRVTGQPFKTSQHLAPPPAPVAIAKQKTPASRVITSPSSLRAHRLEYQRKRQVEGQAKAVASPLDDPVILVQQLPDFRPSGTPSTSSLPDCVDKRVDTLLLPQDEHETTWLPKMANLEFERMVLQLKSAIATDTSDNDEENSDEDVDASVSVPLDSPPTTMLETVRISTLDDPTFRQALQHRLQSTASNATHSVDGELALATLNYMHTYITSLRSELN